MADLSPDAAARLAATAPLRRLIADTCRRVGRPSCTSAELAATRRLQSVEQTTLDLEAADG